MGFFSDSFGGYPAIPMPDMTKTQQTRQTDQAFAPMEAGLEPSQNLQRNMREKPQKPSLILIELIDLHKIGEIDDRALRDCLLHSVRDWFLTCGIPDAELYSAGAYKLCLAVGALGPITIKKLADSLLCHFSGSHLLEHQGTKIRIFCTVSVAVIPGGYLHDDEPLLNMIERTLEIAKTKKRVLIYDGKIDKAYQKQLLMAWSLKKCVHENMLGFNIFFQPIVDSAGESWCGLEALCRWRSPELGPISPLLFIPEAERLDLIGPLGIWALETAIVHCKTWKLDRCDRFMLDVNISAVQFSEETLVAQIVEILERYDYPGGKLCLEITESARFPFSTQSLNALTQLRERQVLVALDDFGTGYANFQMLRDLPVDIVKTERAFAAGIEHDEYHQYLFRAMAELAHTANMKLIAEGVENEKQRDILRLNGADCLQGFFFSKPLPSHQLERKLNHFQEPVS